MPRTRKSQAKKPASSIPNADDIKESSTPNKETVKLLENEVVRITEEDILVSNNSKDLVNFINTLTSTGQDEIIKKFKQTTNLQLKQDSQLIKQLNNELNEKQAFIDSLLRENNELKNSGNRTSSSQATYESPIRGKNVTSNVIQENQLSKELENIGITLDMLELLTGLRIMDYREDATRFFFEIRQTSTNENQVFIDYRLVISKTLEASAEISYVPTFLEVEDMDENYVDDYEEKMQNCTILKRSLPEYLCDNLSFPYNALSQFYTKINRALNRAK